VVELQGVYVSNKQPTSLVKFATAESAIQILSQSSLRWSAPSVFYDPFELNHRSNLDFDSKGLLLACVKNTLGLIFSRDEPVGNSPLIKAVKRWRAEERFDSEDEATDVLSELLSSMVRHREPEMLQIMRDWIKYSSRLRILCLTESHDEPSLWDRYGDNHAGVAIRLATGEDTTLEKPMAVTYSDKKPQISSLKEQMDILMNQSEILVQEGFQDKFLCKSKANSQEKEWRLLRTVKEETNEDHVWFEEFSFPNQEVRAVYLGAAMATDKKLELNTLLLRKFPKVKVFQARAFSDKFELDFERINAA
jgi:hypothetical protein